MKYGVFAIFFCVNPVLTYGATYFVAKTGNNSNSCIQAQSRTTPKLSIGAGIACMASGDTLMISDGTYNENISNTIPAGSPSGSTILKAQNPNAVILLPTTGTASPWFDAVTICDRSYIILDGLVIDAINVPNNALRLSGAATNIIVRNGTIQHGGRGSSSDSGDGIF